MTTYYINTKKFCAGVSVDKGIITRAGTAPCFQWAAKKQMTFLQFKKYLERYGHLISIKKI